MNTKRTGASRLLAAMLTAALIGGAVAPRWAHAQRADYHHSAAYEAGSRRVSGGVFLFFLHHVLLGLGAGAFQAANVPADYAIATSFEVLAIVSIVMGVVELVGGIRLKSSARLHARLHGGGGRLEPSDFVLTL